MGDARIRWTVRLVVSLAASLVVACASTTDNALTQALKDIEDNPEQFASKVIAAVARRQVETGDVNGTTAVATGSQATMTLSRVEGDTTGKLLNITIAIPITGGTRTLTGTLTTGNRNDKTVGDVVITKVNEGGVDTAVNQTWTWQFNLPDGSDVYTTLKTTVLSPGNADSGFITNRVDLWRQ